MEKKLNLGCGSDYRDGWVNADRSGTVRKDAKIDMNAFPWRFRDNEFGHVLARHVIEHVKKESFPKAMAELHRITKPGGTIRIIVPLNKAFNDPTHANPVGIDTFECFASGMYGLPRFSIIKKRITSDKIRTLPRPLSLLFPFTLLSQDLELVLSPVKK
jgi:SAM-dependent methyltransferase